MNNKCYIAGKITGLTEEEYRANFEQAKREVSALGLIPVSPVDLPHDHDKSWGSYMRTDIRAMLECAFVYVLNNWKESPGARVEVELAEVVGMEIKYQG